MSELNEIPPITNPLGKSWTQPNHESIVVTDSYAIVDENEFNQLREYSHTIPSGVYDGKMWKAQAQNGEWFLRWFSPAENPANCKINDRLIVMF